MGTESPLDPLKEFFDCCPELLFSADRNSGIFRMTRSLADALGPGVREGTKLSERVHPDDRSAFDAGWARLGESAEPVQFAVRLKGALDTYRRWSCNARSAPMHGEIHGCLREIVAERAAYSGQGEQDTQFIRLIEESLPIVMWMMDRQGTFIRHSGSGISRVGIKEGQFLGLNFFETFPGRGGFVDGVHQALAGETAHVFTENRGLPWESWYIPVHDAQGQVVSVAGISLDISAAKRAEMELRAKLELIERQKDIIRSLSTPIIEVWDRVLTLPMLGVVDSTRAAELMEALLARIKQRGARFAILDLTGVETVDTGTAGHLLKLLQAIRLLGAEGIITGIQPSVAQTMVALGLHTEGMTTLATLRAGLEHCIRRMRRGKSDRGWSRGG
jgi:rsbT co-antagonist protein RsbR